MTADLKTLVRVRDWQVDEKRRVLGDWLRLVEELKDQVRAFQREVRAEQEIARSSPDEAGMAYGGYARRVLERRAVLQKAVTDAERAVFAAKDDVAKAYRDLKTVQIAQENRERRDAAEAERRESIGLDEIALQGFRQRRADR